MTLQQLRLFTTVAQLENMSRAAELLHMSQSALSKNIAKLEEEIGAPLFSRSGKKIELNAAGVSFLQCCNQLLRSFDSTDVPVIWAQCPDEAGLGLAVANRLKKAAGFHVIEV